MYLRDHCFVVYIDVLNIDVDMLVVKSLPASAGDIWGMGLIPELGRSPACQPTPVFLPGESLGHRSLAVWSTGSQSQTWLKWLNMHTHIHRYMYIRLCFITVWYCTIVYSASPLLIDIFFSSFLVAVNTSVNRLMLPHWKFLLKYLWEIV